MAAHAITTSALGDLYLDIFFQSEMELGNSHEICAAASAVNSACQDNGNEGLIPAHITILATMETHAIATTLKEFDERMETLHPTLKFAREYMTFFGWVWMFIHAT